MPEITRSRKHNRVIELFVVAGVLLVATILIYLTQADLRLARMIFFPDSFWPGKGRFPWDVIYHVAPVPGFCIAGCALLTLFVGIFYRRVKKWRREAVLLLLLLVVGPGLIVNVLLKDQLGRARPREVIERGNEYQYTEFWVKGTAGDNSSFPSGHASIAFYALGPWFVFRNRKQKVALSFLVFGVGYGAVVGLGRMLQGGHFLSDVLWAGGIVYLVGGGLALLLLPGVSSKKS